MKFWYFDGNRATRIPAGIADRDYRDTDAGTDEAFIVMARDEEEAEAGARLWISARGDDEVAMMPDGLWLDERLLRRDGVGGSYMILCVDR